MYIRPTIEVNELKLKKYHLSWNWYITWVHCQNSNSILFKVFFRTVVEKEFKKISIAQTVVMRLPTDFGSETLNFNGPC